MAVNKEAEIRIDSLKRASIKLRLIGTTALIQNRMPSKVMQGLLVGTRKKTKAERIDIKHDPLLEYRMAAEMMTTAGHTALGMRTVAVKAAMATAALETAGVTKTSAQRLLFLPGDKVPLYGIPKLRMDVVRSADMNRTPDVRSRPCMEQWGCEVEINFIAPQLSSTSVANLLFNAGLIIGVGDGRQEKGKLGCGLFRVISADERDQEWDHLVKHCGRKAQEAALASPEFYDQDAADLFQFWQEEVARRSSGTPLGGVSKSKRNGRMEAVI